MITVKVSENDLIAEMVANSNKEDLINFISDLVDYVEGYGFDFRDEVIKRMEADK